jgi:hypothetical protein
VCGGDGVEVADGLIESDRTRTFIKQLIGTYLGGYVMEMNSNKRALDKIYKRRDRFEIADWQREEVWGTEKQRRLIDTILRGWKLPKFYFLKTSDSPEQFDVVDGQQRLSAIWEFLDGNLVLSDETASEFGGKTYATLSSDISDAFDDYEIEYDEIIGATDEAVHRGRSERSHSMPGSRFTDPWLLRRAA